MAVAVKNRLSSDRVAINSIVVDDHGRRVIVLDEETTRGSTFFELAERLRDHDVPSGEVACRRGLFAGRVLKRITDHPQVTEVVFTSTRPLTERELKLRVLSMAPILAEAMRRIHRGESVGSLFH